MRLRIVWVVAVLAMVAALVPATGAVADDDPGEGDEFEGVIQSLPATPGFVGDWVVSGKTVHVSAETEIDDEDGAVAVGATVDVEGTANTDGTFSASQIEVGGDDEGDDDSFGEISFEGFIQSLPGTADFVGDWMVSGLLVHVTTSTEIDQSDGPVVVGAAVEVEGLLAPDGSVTASQIEVKDESDIEENSLTLTGIASRIPHNAQHLGTWRVSKQQVRVGSRTTIVRERRLGNGSMVRVFGTFRANGSIRASKVVVKT